MSNQYVIAPQERDELFDSVKIQVAHPDGRHSYSLHEGLIAIPYTDSHESINNPHETMTDTPSLEPFQADTNGVLLTTSCLLQQTNNNYGPSVDTASVTQSRGSSILNYGAHTRDPFVLQYKKSQIINTSNNSNATTTTTKQSVTNTNTKSGFQSPPTTGRRYSTNPLQQVHAQGGYQQQQQQVAYRGPFSTCHNTPNQLFGGATTDSHQQQQQQYKTNSNHPSTIKTSSSSFIASTSNSPQPPAPPHGLMPFSQHPVIPTRSSDSYYGPTGVPTTIGNHNDMNNNDVDEHFWLSTNNKNLSNNNTNNNNGKFTTPINPYDPGMTSVFPLCGATLHPRSSAPQSPTYPKETNHLFYSPIDNWAKEPISPHFNNHHNSTYTGTSSTKYHYNNNNSKSTMARTSSDLSTTNSVISSVITDNSTQYSVQPQQQQQQQQMNMRVHGQSAFQPQQQQQHYHQIQQNGQYA